MVKAIALFELENGVRRISTYIYFLLFLAFGYLMFVAAGGAFAGVDLGLGAGGKVFANSPYLLYAFISSLSFYGLLVVAAVMGYSGQQDFQHQTYPLIFTEPISKLQYLAGRFIAANILLLFIFSSIGIGCILGSWMPFLDEQLVSTNHIMAYVQPYVLVVIPNTFFIGGTYAWATYVAEVEVDLRTFTARVIDFVAVQEVGKVLHEVIARGQICGGVVQGIGWALLEECKWRDGAMWNHQLTNYIIPTSDDVPPIRVVFLENPYAHGAQGAKGLGELPIDGPAPAILNAVAAATGTDPRAIPLTPERLMGLVCHEPVA